MISLINPVRACDAMPNFMISQNRLIEGWVVNIAIDLNIIAKMEKCFFEKKTLEETGLNNFVNLLKCGNTIIMPGIAFFEVSTEFSIRARDGFEGFLLKYLPNYSDSSDTTHSPDRAVTQTRRYADASNQKRLTFSRTYMAMLLLFIISKDKVINPEEKFSKFLRRMVVSTGGVGVLEARTAQFVFFDRSKLPDGPWSTFCRSIRDNFLKSGGTSEKIKINSFNQAHDLSLAKFATYLHGHTENGFRNDYWVATDDEGLTNLCSTFRYNVGDDGFYNGEFVCIDNLFSELEAAGFWKNTNNEWNCFQNKRIEERKSCLINDFTFEELELNVKVLHEEVDSILEL